MRCHFASSVLISVSHSSWGFTQWAFRDVVWVEKPKMRNSCVVNSDTKKLIEIRTYIFFINIRMNKVTRKKWARLHPAVLWKLQNCEIENIIFNFILISNFHSFVFFFCKLWPAFAIPKFYLSYAESKFSKQIGFGETVVRSRSRARLERDYARLTPTVPACRRRNFRFITSGRTDRLLIRRRPQEGADVIKDGCTKHRLRRNRF